MVDSFSGRVVYVVGPSGAGKDYLLNLALTAIGDTPDVHFIQRDITRPLTPNASEAHNPVSNTYFDATLKAGGYFHHWRAHGFGYGIPKAYFDGLLAHATVVICGSRGAIVAAQAVFGNLVVVHITASKSVLRERLESRAREGSKAIEARLTRDVFIPQTQSEIVTITNDHSPDRSVAQLVAVITGGKRNLAAPPLS